MSDIEIIPRVFFSEMYVRKVISKDLSFSRKNTANV